MLISQYEGLKFPVEYLIRFFFKEGLNRRQGRVLELGCGNGNNLMLFYQYGWDVVGVDNGATLIEQANHNFALVKSNYRLANQYQHHCADMVDFIEQYQSTPFDVLLMPHSIYYLPYDRIQKLLQLFKVKKIVGPDSLLFLTVRTPEDYRFGRGEQIGEKTYRLNIEETGEKGCTITFLFEWEVVDLLYKTFNFHYLQISHQNYGNYINNRLISNSDITLWGKIKKILV
jgi:SAM-dependent methyltransferase